MFRTLLSTVTLITAIAAGSSAHAAGPLHMYGPGGPLPAMKEAAAAFGRSHGVAVDVVAGPTPQWIDHAKADADLIFSGSEVMMSDFISAMPDIAPNPISHVDIPDAQSPAQNSSRGGIIGQLLSPPTKPLAN
jgi:accessory colonization factor AcfC